jgi:predicted nucleic acid-binding protein
MNANEIFFDTNILLYLFSQDDAKAERAEALVADGGLISVQVLNELASVATRKLKMSWVETREILSLIRALCKVEPVTVATHEQGIFLAERYGFSVYDAMITASALLSGCHTLYTEDLQNGQRIEKSLTIRNPFVQPPMSFPLPISDLP